MTIKGDMVSIRTVDWTNHSPQGKLTEQSHRDKSHVQFFGQIRVLALGLDDSP